MGADVVFDSLILDRCLRSGWHLDVVMLLLLGVASLMCKTDSVVFRLPGSCIWRGMIWWHLPFFWSVTYSMPYWSTFPFQIWFYRSSRVCTLIPIREIRAKIMACSLFYDDPSIEPLWGHSARPAIHLIAILGHISVSGEIYRSPWIYMIIPAHKVRAETTICLLLLRWSLNGASREPSNKAHISQHSDAIMPFQ